MINEAMAKLRAAGKDQRHLPFGILITGDEEVGGFDGAQQALKKIKARFCIALDGGRPDQIVVKEKGVLRLKLTSHGKAAHGARPWLGTNAIERMVNDYFRIKRHFTNDTPDHWHRTINWGIVRAGESVNQVPDFAEAWLDIRFTENDNMQALIDQIRAEIDGEIEIKEHWPLFVGGDSPFLDALKRVAHSAECVFEHGASDARFLSSHGVPGVVWGADGEMSQHSADEHVVIESVSRLHDMLADFIAQVELDLQRGKL
jgi:succinyl-diaminopimelate desuccinylase